MTNHIFHPSILRAYDIRGIVDETLSLADAWSIGLSFAACLDERGQKIMLWWGVMDGFHQWPWLLHFVTDLLRAE